MPAADEVRAMFGAIACRYDTLNRVLSLGTDRAWRRRTCDLLAIAPGELAADLCCGTGDLAMEMASRGARVVGVDFSPEMLRLAAAKGARGLTEADCLRLPFPDGRFDVATVAFGVRNLADLGAGLREILRVLRPGGRAGILEFAHPTGTVFPWIYRGYLRWAVPSIGAALSGRRAAYDYLGSSIEQFPDQPRMETILVEAGFGRVRHVNFARGIAALYLGCKGSRAD
ncbi:MAG: bifunctional demethylmenaquinone methyltransferase/2-methoxy-6-polyprenyl-1,4-benzoquinol methylase UbiE [Candidatus Polarisedimenticolia bacterium]